MGYIPPPMPRDPRLLPAYIEHCERAAREERAKAIALLPFVLLAVYATTAAVVLVALL